MKQNFPSLSLTGHISKIFSQIYERFIRLHFHDNNYYAKKIYQLIYTITKNSI